MATDKRSDLDAALREGGQGADREVGDLVEVADDLRQTFAVEAPAARASKAMFVNAVGARRSTGPSLTRLALPALAVAGVVLALGTLSRATLPGDPLYPVRRVLQTTGVTDTPIEDIDRLLGSAERSIESGEDIEGDDPEAAKRDALDALIDLGRARRIALGVGASELLEEVNDLEDEANKLFEDAEEELQERSGGDDNSGSGSDDSGGDDNSGSGSDDSGGDDNSGSGGDSSGGDDNSGSGGGGDSGKG